MTAGDGTSLLQAGGVLAFALLTLYILRDLKPVIANGLAAIWDAIKELTEELFEVRIIQQALLEQARIRDVKRKREPTAPPPNRTNTPRSMPVVQTSAPVVPTGEFDREETTNIHELIELARAQAEAKKAERAEKRGARPPRPGTHHDRQGEP